MVQLMSTGIAQANKAHFKVMLKNKLSEELLPQVCEVKSRTVQKGFVDRKVFSTLSKIVKKAKIFGWTTKMMKKYNRLDREVTNIMLKAECQ